MPRKRVSKITVITKTEFTDGSSLEKVEVSEFKSTSLSYATPKTIDLPPIS